MYKIFLTYLFIIIPGLVFCQEKNFNHTINLAEQDTVFYEIVPRDTVPSDSLITIDTIRIDSLNPPVIEAPIVYNAEDSIIVSFDGQKVFLYNNAKVTYQQIELTAYFIQLDLETKEVYAEGMTDTTGTLVQKPVFKDGSDEFESKTLRYNFETEKGIITDVVTEQGEGYVHSERTKKISKDAFLMIKGKYTTCDAEHPHFYLNLSKAKVISGKKIITGPAYMVLEDFPIYFPFLPFGYFPSTPTYSSGIIMPSYGEEVNRGFFLRDGGYYWAAGQYFDLALRGDIYSKGSWSGKLNTSYRKRYKFSGNFDFKYAVNIYGEKGLDTYSRSPQFAVTWSHSQDAKANPNQTFSASVNFSTSGYDKQNSYSAENYLRTSKSSSISFTRKFENTPFNMSVNLRHSQNSTDSTITLSLPELTFSMAKVYPFRSKNRKGPLKWYQNFGVNYTGNFRNTITARESELLHTSLAKDWKNGLKHNFPVALPNFNIAKYINVSPGLSYNEKWYFKKVKYSYHEDETFSNDIARETHVRMDTITGLNRVYDYSYALSLTTNIYGSFIPLNPNSKINKIRHKMTPAIGISYRPDFGKSHFGYWQPIQVDSTGRIEYFDVNRGGIYGGSPGRGASGSVSFSLNNNLEMKVLDVKDTTKTDAEQKFKKVKIIDNLSLSTSYDLIADSFNLAPIGIRARTTIAGVSINMGTNIDPYIIDENYRRVNEYAWNVKKGFAKLGRVTSANLSFGMNFTSKQGKKEAEENKELVEGEKLLPGDYANYTDFNVPWDFGFDYNLTYAGPTKISPKGRVMQTIGLRGNLNLTEKWRISMNTNYDIMAGEFSFTTFNVNRDLHCWTMAFNFVPFGYMKSYSFTINAQSSLLKDLKLSKRQSHYDNF